MKRTLWLWFVIAGLATTHSAQCGTKLASHVAAYVGQQVPGYSQLTFTSLGTPSISTNGVITFDSGVPTWSSPFVVRRTAGGEYSLALNAAFAPGEALGQIGMLGGLVGNDDHAIAALSNASSFGFYNSVLAGPAGSVAVLARLDAPAPGLTDSVHDRGFKRLHQAESGAIAFFGQIRPAPGLSGDVGGVVWRSIGGIVQPLLQHRQHVFGLNANQYVDFFDGSEPQITIGNAGRMAVVAGFRTEGSPSVSGNRAIYTGDNASSMSVALRRAQEVALGSGTFWIDSVTIQDISSTGSILIGGLAVKNNQGGSRSALWRQAVPGGSVELLGFRGDMVSGFAPDRTIQQIGQSRLLPDGRVMALLAVGQAAMGTWTSALAYRDDDGWHKILATGDAAPGLSNGEVMGGSLSNGILFRHMNDAGAFAFLGMYTGGAAGTSSVMSIWAGQLGGDIYLVASVGDRVVVAPGDDRTILGLQLDSVSTGTSIQGISQNNWLTYRASFTDGTSAIFTTRIPSPPTVLSALIAVALMRRRGTVASRRVECQRTRLIESASAI
ncbi:MAG: hypothetical protein KF768_10290 [Phycisphaeraceae bacterium]|nr:hypothetical protein [Phycisphaeraceae bacterium]